MKPFSLEKALMGEPVVTRDGYPVTEIYHFTTTYEKHPVRAVIDNSITAYSMDGKYAGTELESGHDLFMGPIKKQGWVNIYPGYRTGGAQIYPTKKEAEDSANGVMNNIATVMVEWEE